MRADQRIDPGPAALRVGHHLYFVDHHHVPMLVAEAGELLHGAAEVRGAFTDDFFLAGDQRAGHAHRLDALLILQRHQAQRREIDGVFGGCHRLDGAMRLAAVGRAEQGDPASRQPARRIELVVVNEARVVLQQHGKRHAFLMLAAGGANRLAHAAGFQGDELGKTLVPEQLQVEIAGELKHALEGGLQLVAILALPGLDFRHAEQMILAGRNAPLQFEGEIAALQRHHVAQLMANLVEGGDGMREKFIDP